MPLPRKITLCPLNTQIVKLSGLRNSLTGAALNDAVVLITLTGRGGPVTGCIALRLEYVPGSDGDYRAVIGEEFNSAVDEGYTLTITASQDQSKATWSIPAAVAARGAG